LIYGNREEVTPLSEIKALMESGGDWAAALDEEFPMDEFFGQLEGMDEFFNQPKDVFSPKEQDILHEEAFS
jgi:hypothetical protein